MQKKYQQPKFDELELLMDNSCMQAISFSETPADPEIPMSAPRRDYKPGLE